MSDFINDWVRCNICFKGFDQTGGMLTSCGHFLCGRTGCRIITQDDKLICPVCKSECGAISLTDSLPPDILNFFEEPINMIQKAMSVLKFHNHQKELSRIHYEKSQRRIKELEKEVDDLRKQNKKLLESTIKHPLIENAEIPNKPQSVFKSECFIPEIVGQTPHSIIPNENKKSLVPTDKLFQKVIHKNNEIDHEEQDANNLKNNSNSQSSIPMQSKDKETQPLSNIFTPTLAHRLQNLTGKKFYSPVQPKD
ncbi:hypothetical protein M9Y10_041941 [Tritrichomonas musculus]|uniref:RING-type domain-containing protein n=1 Tax=Tritrichomonas musculus TaxID=1915356 RepID=A0ABR2K5T1_9EUKA